jgi:hypothetical protein
MQCTIHPKKRFGKRNILIVLLVLISSNFIFSQGNESDDFIFEYHSASGDSKIYYPGSCGFGLSTFGASVQEDLCGDLVWAYDISPDSLCCDDIVMDLTGKIALIRRGICDFSLKALEAQEAGAIACLIVNHYDDPAQTDCSVFLMASGVDGPLITIPCIFLCRAAGEAIDAQLQAGNDVEGCFLLPRVTGAWAALSYATPVSQLDTMRAFGVNFINRSPDTIPNLTLKADISGPNGYSYSYTTVQGPIAPEEERLLLMDGYPPNPEVGTYQVTFSNDYFTESRDTLIRNFAVTEDVFANDNLELQLDGGADRNDLFLQGYEVYQTGSLYWTGPDGATAKYISFGIANIDSVFTWPGNDLANTIYCLLYDGDADNDGTINLTSDFSDVASDLVASGQYIMEGTEKEENLLCVQLQSFFDPGNPPVLLPSHPYYVSLLYDGNNAGTGRNCAFSNSSHEDYLLIAGGGATPIFLGQYFNEGWGDRTVVQRLVLEGDYCQVISTKHLLQASKISITPNPGNVFIQVNLALERNNNHIVASLFNGQGQVVQQVFEKNIQNGSIQLDVRNLPSGNYILAVNTEEGYAIRTIAICH